VRTVVSELEIEVELEIYGRVSRLEESGNVGEDR